MRRNTLPVKRIDGSLVMRHEHAARAVVELMQIGKTSSGADPVLQHAPEAFDGIEVVSTAGWQEMQQFPLLTCESYMTMVADNAVRVSNSHCRLSQGLFGCHVPSYLVAGSRLSSWRRTYPPTGRAPG
jgi:hypothetical protein